MKKQTWSKIAILTAGAAGIYLLLTKVLSRSASASYNGGVNFPSPGLFYKHPDMLVKGSRDMTGPMTGWLASAGSVAEGINPVVQNLSDPPRRTGLSMYPPVGYAAAPGIDRPQGSLFTGRIFGLQGDVFAEIFYPTYNDTAQIKVIPVSRAVWENNVRTNVS